MICLVYSRVYLLQNNVAQCAVCRAPADPKEVKRIQNDQIEIQEKVEIQPKKQPLLFSLNQAVSGQTSTKVVAFVKVLFCCFHIFVFKDECFDFRAQSVRCLEGPAGAHRLVFGVSGNAAGDSNCVSRQRIA